MHLRLRHDTRDGRADGTEQGRAAQVGAQRDRRAAPLGRDRHGLVEGEAPAGPVGLGATVALRIAVAAPDAVRTLTLIEPVRRWILKKSALARRLEALFRLR